MVLAERLVLVCHESLVGFDLSFVSKTGRFEVCVWLVKLSRAIGSPFVCFVLVADKSFVRRG